MKATVRTLRRSTRHSRRARLLQWADLRSVPLRTILVTIAIVVAVYLLGKLLYRLRDVVLLMLVGAFVALVLNPLVVALQRWKVPRRGLAVAIVTLWAALLFAGLALAFGYPLVNSVTHSQTICRLRRQGAAREGLDRPSRPQVPHRVLGEEELPEDRSFAESLGKPALNLGKGAFSSWRSRSPPVRVRDPAPGGGPEDPCRPPR